MNLGQTPIKLNSSETAKPSGQFWSSFSPSSFFKSSKHPEKPQGISPVDKSTAPFRLYDSNSLEISYLDTRFEQKKPLTNFTSQTPLSEMGNFRNRNFGSEIFSSSPALNKRFKSVKNMSSSSSFVVSTSKAEANGTRLEIVKNPESERPTLELKITPRKFSSANINSDHSSICNAYSVPHTPISSERIAPKLSTEKLRVSADFLLRIHNAEIKTERKNESVKKTKWWRLGSKIKPGPKKSLSLNSRCDVSERTDFSEITGNSVWHLREDDEVPWKNKSFVTHASMNNR